MKAFDEPFPGCATIVAQTDAGLATRYVKPFPAAALATEPQTSHAEASPREGEDEDTDGVAGTFFNREGGAA